MDGQSHAESGSPTNRAHQFGHVGEQAAAEWYEAAGYRILDRNWRCSHGEVDLVVAGEAVVVFVEVKARSSGRYGSGFDAVDWRKQRRLRQLARLWLNEYRASEPSDPLGQDDHGYFCDVRFDVVDVDRRGTVRVRHDCF